MDDKSPGGDISQHEKRLIAWLNNCNQHMHAKPFFSEYFSVGSFKQYDCEVEHFAAL